MFFSNKQLTGQAHFQLRSMIVVVLCIFLSSILQTLNAAGARSDPVNIAKKLQSSYEKAQNLVAEFKQITAMQLSSRIKEGAGTMVFLKPGHMRWDYMTPERQVLISDGKTISMYFEKSKQMIRTAAKEFIQSDVTYSFFTGTGDILKDFEILEPDLTYKKTDDSYLIKLVPVKAHPQVAYMHFWISRDTYLVNRLQIVDHFETVTDLFFSNIKVNAGQYNKNAINDDLFFFMPPADTEVIEQ
jgi:outer membrane lipoprotein carrier protein